MYLIFNEDDELYRIVRFKVEAELMCKIREGWYFKYVKREKKVVHYEPAPF